MRYFFTFPPLKALFIACFLLSAVALPRPLTAIELCSEEAEILMKKVGVTKTQMDKMCKMARVSSSVFTLSISRKENELGYCRVTLLLNNNSSRYINQLSLTSVKGLYEIFRFHNILPGMKGYSSSLSRSLLACDELSELGIRFHWPISLRVDDRSVGGGTLEQMRPRLLGKILKWDRE